MNPSGTSHTLAPSFISLDKYYLHLSAHERRQPFLLSLHHERPGEPGGVRYDVRAPLLQLAAVHKSVGLLGVLEHGALDPGLHELRVRQVAVVGTPLDADEGPARRVSRAHAYRVRS